MKRKDREVKDLDTIKDFVSKCQVVRIGMCCDNIPYVVPLNYGFEFEGDNLILYCHCSNTGKKLDILSKNPNVFIEIDNEYNLIKGDTPCEYGFEYFSVMSHGKVEFVHNIYDKIHGLNKIMEHYTSNYNNQFKDKILNKVFLLKITCNNLSAKRCKS
ncbi:pyridoxamine 5'-phosphate oxidase family protein [Terrisporobacter sp.]